jgi:hypothetical protein
MKVVIKVENSIKEIYIIALRKSCPINFKAYATLKMLDGPSISDDCVTTMILKYVRI